MKPTSLPLAGSVQPIEQLIAHIVLAQHRLIGVALEMGGDGVAIHRARALDGLRQNLSVGVVEWAAVVIGIDAGDLLVQLVKSARLLVVRSAAKTENVFRGAPGPR